MKTLELHFETEKGDRAVIMVDHPLLPLQVNTVKNVMEQLVALNIFTVKGSPLATVTRAVVVSKDEEQFILNDELN